MRFPIRQVEARARQPSRETARRVEMQNWHQAVEPGAHLSQREQTPGPFLVPRELRQQADWQEPRGLEAVALQRAPMGRGRRRSDAEVGSKSKERSDAAFPASEKTSSVTHSCLLLCCLASLFSRPLSKCSGPRRSVFPSAIPTSIAMRRPNKTQSRAVFSCIVVNCGPSQPRESSKAT